MTKPIKPMSLRGPLPRKVEEYRHELRVKQAHILHKYTDYLNSKLDKHGPEFFDTPTGKAGVDNLLKLELKDRQIVANREVKDETNNVLLEAIKRAQQTVDKIDNKPASKVMLEVVADVQDAEYED